MTLEESEPESESEESESEEETPTNIKKEKFRKKPTIPQERLKMVMRCQPAHLRHHEQPNQQPNKQTNQASKNFGHHQPETIPPSLHTPSASTPPTPVPPPLHTSIHEIRYDTPTHPTHPRPETPAPFPMPIQQPTHYSPDELGRQTKKRLLKE
jgi:hypothetical protein